MKINQYKLWILVSILLLPLTGKSEESKGILELLEGNWLDLFYPGITLLLFLFFCFSLYKVINLSARIKEVKIYDENGYEAYLKEKKENEASWVRKFGSQFSNAVPIEHEEDILLDHDYDGIKELNNSLPSWWLYGFYFTIVIGVGYFAYYHLSDYGTSSQEWYEEEMVYSKLAVEKYLSTQANLVDESNVDLLTDEALLLAGKQVFEENCIACHLKSGGGSPVSVGPNLTDKYWIHGGGIKDVFKTIKYGVPEKGMISWQSQLRPSDMHKVASYILSLQGSNPENAKEPQGTLYVAEQEVISNDTLGVQQ
jgi:cytochrome c oxidase cbb3-type subunit 3